MLIIAVIGGISHLEGAWIGAFAYTLIDYYSRQDAPTWGLWLNPGRFATIIGLVFLLIVLLSPDGLIGIGQKLWRLTGLGRAHPTRPGESEEEQALAEGASMETPSSSGVQEA